MTVALIIGGVALSAVLGGLAGAAWMAYKATEGFGR